MFKKFMKTDKNESKLTAFANKVEKLSEKELTKVTGGDGGTNPPPTPDDAARVKSHSNTNNN